jgi:hypothetical protein
MAKSIGYHLWVTERLFGEIKEREREREKREILIDRLRTEPRNNESVDIKTHKKNQKHIDRFVLLLSYFATSGFYNYDIQANND